MRWAPFYLHQRGRIMHIQPTLFPLPEIPDLKPPPIKGLIASFKVVGAPRGKGRPRFSGAGGFVRTYNPPETENYERKVRANAINAMHDKKPIAGAIAIYVVAYMPIPESWSKRKKLEALTGHLAATCKPDLDNIIKITKDGMNKIVYEDDKQVVQVYSWKMYAEHARLEVSVFAC